MSRKKAYWPTIIAAVMLFGAIAVGANAAGTFVEPNVRVLHEFDGTAGPGSYFGWAVSELGDVDGDHVDEAIVDEPFNGPDGATGSVFVYSGRDGHRLYRFDGVAGDWYGFAIADAGDVNGDHVHDILVGAPGNGAGHVDLYSGKTGELLHRFTGASVGDTFGWSVSSAGDVNGDHRADVLIGAPQALSGAGPGYASIYSGRTYELIRTVTGDAIGDQLGSGAGWTADVNRDRVPDQIVGARDAGAGDRGQVYVYSGKTGDRLLAIDASPNGDSLGSFFVAGVGDVNRDGTPDIYAGDYYDSTNGSDPAAFTDSGRAGVYSGRDGHELLAWVGSDADAGLGPGRGAGDVNHDGHPDLIVGSYTSNAGASNAGRVQIFSGADGSVLRTVTSKKTDEELGFDAVGLGGTNRDGVPDELVSAANGNHVYIIAGTPPRD
jgi:FG-GAP repeat